MGKKLHLLLRENCFPEYATLFQRNYERFLSVWNSYNDANTIISLASIIKIYCLFQRRNFLNLYVMFHGNLSIMEINKTIFYCCNFSVKRIFNYKRELDIWNSVFRKFNHPYRSLEIAFLFHCYLVDIFFFSLFLEVVVSVRFFIFEVPKS